MSGVWGTRGWTGVQRRTAAGAVLLLGVIVALDLSSDRTILLSLLVVVPLVAALACPPRAVVAVALLTLVTTVVMGAVDSVFLGERHVVALVVVAMGSLVAVIAARSRTALAAVRETERTAFGRIALLDRSSRLIAAPMDFGGRLRDLSRLVIPDVADVAVIDLATPDGRLEGVIASSSVGEVGELVERTRARSPIDPAGEHPVAVALRTRRPQLLRDWTDEVLGLTARSAVVVPLVARGDTLGVLSVLRIDNPEPFEGADTSLLSDLASRAALAVDNARLFEERAAAEAQLQAIIDNLAEAVTVTAADGRLVYINSAAAELMGYGPAEEALRVPLAQMYADFELFDEQGVPLDPARLPGRRVLAGEENPEPLTVLRRHVASGEERWLTVKASCVRDPATGEPSLAVNVIEDVTAQRRAHAASDFLSEATKLLGSSLDYSATLRAVAEAAVPQIADWCAVDLLNEEGSAVPVALAHVDTGKESIVAELRERYPPDPDADSGAPLVRRTGESQLYPEIDPELLEASARDERHLELLRALDMTSVLIVPLRAGEKTIGTMSFVTTGGRRRLGEPDRELAEELGRRAGVAVEHARVHEERSLIAATLQRSLLPPRLPVVPGVTLAARFRAAGEANQVGGDFYDLFRVADGWMLVIGDVTGKGPGAAAITSLARYTIRTAAMYDPEPDAVMRRLNEILLGDAEHPQMCTAACLRIATSRGGEPVRAQLVCAGHPPPYLLRAPGTIEELCRPGPLLGAFPSAEWEPATIELAPGDGIVLYTDGVTDARGASGRFGQERLEAVLREVAGAEADEIAEALDASLMAFEEGPQRDDVAVLVLRATDNGGAPETAVVAGSSSVEG